MKSKRFGKNRYPRINWYVLKQVEYLARVYMKEQGIQFTVIQTIGDTRYQIIKTSRERMKDGNFQIISRPFVKGVTNEDASSYRRFKPVGNRKGSELPD